MVERYYQSETEVLGEKRVSVPLCPPQIPQGLDCWRPAADYVSHGRSSLYVDPAFFSLGMSLNTFKQFVFVIKIQYVFCEACSLTCIEASYG
jgi:hypothetical protein